MLQSLVRSIGAVALLLAVLLGTVGTVSAAHNGNNKASLTGTGGEADASGQSIVNYREGTGTFNGKVSVTGLVPGATYTFLVRAPATAGGGETRVCSGEANAQGTFSCAAQDIALPGFVAAVVRDATGTEVATGTYERRGNCRDPQQAGSQCNAPGHD
ncbi:MAG TPA: hypothetical protein VGT61_09935 [Thermomicrobiales bacterium]|nr:hypothetical protein [Thermomicrobiales bacterium]